MALLGAALMAASGTGIETAPEIGQPHISIQPDRRNTARYQQLFQHYLELQTTVRHFHGYSRDRDSK